VGVGAELAARIGHGVAVAFAWVGVDEVFAADDAWGDIAVAGWVGGCRRDANEGVEDDDAWVHGDVWDGRDGAVDFDGNLGGLGVAGKVNDGAGDNLAQGVGGDGDGTATRGHTGANADATRAGVGTGEAYCDISGVGRTNIGAAVPAGGVGRRADGGGDGGFGFVEVDGGGGLGNVARAVNGGAGDGLVGGLSAHGLRAGTAGDAGGYGTGGGAGEGNGEGGAIPTGGVGGRV